MLQRKKAKIQKSRNHGVTVFFTEIYVEELTFLFHPPQKLINLNKIKPAPANI